MKLLIATTNRGKVNEIAEHLRGAGFEPLGLADLEEAIDPPEETGETFAENAMLKADYYHRRTGLMTMADDSGLEVDALGGRPGVHSARYGGGNLSSHEQVALLLDEMKDVQDRTARFRCVIAVSGDGVRRIFEGSSDGRIARAPAGEYGFGYDPVFIDPESGRTYAELSPAEKSSRSHRGKALRDASRWLRGLA